MRALTHAVPSDTGEAFRSNSLVAFDLGKASTHLPAAQTRESLTPTSGTKSQNRQMDKVRELEQMIEFLRRQREDCEPKSNQNPRYLHYSNAVSALRWILDDIHREEDAAS